MAEYSMHVVEAENERGEMEKAPGMPCLCGVCKGERGPLLPGDPDRHDMAAGDITLYGIAVKGKRTA